MYDYFIFLLNIAGLIIRVICIFLFLLIYFQTRKKVFAWCAILFGALCTNTILLYMADFLPGFSNFYNTQIDSEPLARSLLDMGYIVSYRMIIRHGLHLPLKRGEPLCIALLFLMIPVCWLAPASPALNLFYTTLSWFYTFAVFLLGILQCRICSYPEQTKRILRFFLSVFLILEILAYLEVLRWTHTGESYFEAALPSYGQRLIFTALIGLLQNFLGIIYGFYYLRKIIAKPDESSLSEPAVLAFAEKIKLTQRETEILKLVLKQMKNQEIAEELHISLGTVKTHIHNIFTKAEVESREQLSKRAGER